MSSVPKLAPPGAGVPFFQSLILRYGVGPFVAARSDWDQNFLNFDKVNQKILKLIEGLGTAEMETKILVPPQVALEDSSRFWSLSMTLEHLCIVTPQMKDLIISLSRGVVPDVQVSTARVKPLGVKPTEEVLKEFKAMIESTVPEIKAKVQNRQSKLKLKHPWFGPSTLLQWQWVMASHHGLHYQQMKAIKKGLQNK